MNQVEMPMQRTLRDGRVAEILPLLFDRARIGVGPADRRGYDDVW